MGSKFAPIYATLVLAYLEEKMYEQSEKDFIPMIGTFFKLKAQPWVVNLLPFMQLLS